MPSPNDNGRTRASPDRMEAPVPSPVELDNLRARLYPADRDRLWPDGLLEPDLPLTTLCGGLESPYLSSERDSTLAEWQPKSSQLGMPW